MKNVSSRLRGLLARLAGFNKPRQARRFSLSTDDAPARVRFLSVAVELAEGQKTSWVTVTRTGTFTDPRYGEFSITPAMLAEMVKNFDARVLGQDVFIDVAHRPSDGAAARVLRLAVEGSRLRALVEWTDFGLDAVRKRGFTYLSAEFHEAWKDNERGNAHGCVLIGAGLTTRPVIKHLDPVALALAESDPTDPDDDTAAKLAVHPHLLQTLESDMNKHLQALRTKLLAQGLTEAQIAPILAAALKQLEAAAADDAKCLALVDTFTAAGESLAAHLKTLGAPAPAAGATGAPITLQVGNGLDAAAVTREVQRVLAEQAAAAATAATTLAGKVKLLADTVNAATTVPEADRTAAVKELSALVTPELSDEQVKRLAEFALAQLGKTSAAAQLAALGYRPPSGSVHITVESGNQIKALQEQVDRRLGVSGQPDAQRFARTGGQLLAVNKAYADKVLAQFDEIHGARLAGEHKMLAAGTGQIGDFAVPAVFERTVIREALYNLVGLNFVDVGTAAFAPVIQVPYSYRDTTAAGINTTRNYELSAIPKAGVIQTFDEARPIPQKLSMLISNEMQYLLNGAPIDFDPLAENMRNISRIIGEDTDRLIQNEVLNSADEALVTAGQSDTITAQVNGTNRIFVLTQFPVVRPRQVFDLKGVQVGSTVNPITVTLNSVARTEYRTGVTLSAGLYWIMDYNLGEIRFVNELGVLQTPTNAWPLVVVYSWTQNVSKFNLDVQANPDTINAVYDRLLTSIGSRKVVIENDRYYMANMALMSGAVDNSLGQATTFTANGSRPGTGMNADGSIGVVKGLPVFNTRAPGLATADARIIIGERGNTRFRMLRPFSMVDITEAHNAAGAFIGAKESYGEQFVVAHTPTQRRNANTSVVLYSVAGRVARA